MAVPSLPFVFSANTLIQSAQVNSNLATLVSALTANLDSTNFSVARGLGANYITSLGTGNTGAFQAGAYTFTPNTNAVVPLAVVGLTGQSVDLFDVSTSAAKSVWVDSGGVLHTLLAPVGPNGGTFLDTSATGQTKTGPLTVGSLIVANGGALFASASHDLLVRADTSAGAVLIQSAGGAANNAIFPDTGGFTLIRGPLTVTPFSAAGVVVNNASGVLASTLTPIMSGASITATTIPNAALVSSTISGVALGGTLFSHTPGTHLTGGAYNGSGAVTLGTDATNANTASTIVARDGAGAFSMGALTATSAAAALYTTGSTAFTTPLGSAGNIEAGTMGTASSGSLNWGNNGGGTGYAFIAGGVGVTIGPVTDTVMLIGQRGIGNFVVLDASGNLGVLGKLTATGLSAGTGTVQGSSNGSTVTYLPPVYDNAGAAPASTMHINQMGLGGGSNKIATGATTQAITFSNASTMANNSYVVLLSFETNATVGSIAYNGGVWWISNKTTTGFTVNVTTAPAGGSNNYQFSWLAIGA